jgi:predicted methyltransferase
MKRFLSLGLTTFLLSILSVAPVNAALSATDSSLLSSAIAGPQRSPEHKARDQYRHPQQTLNFFDVKPNMRVVEVLPGAGWYTEILAPYLYDKGHLIEATFPSISPNPFFRKMAARFHQKLSANPEVYGHVRLEPFAPPDYMPLGAPGSVDRVLTFRNIHDLIFVNVHHETTDIILQQFLHQAYQVLKPGGILGIVSHRAALGMSVAKSSQLGRVPEAYLVHEARKAGFVMAGRSEINANPRDNHKRPVWVLPPSLRLKDQDRTKYLKIGEADNMTLKFMKPSAKKRNPKAPTM